MITVLKLEGPKNGGSFSKLRPNTPSLSSIKKYMDVKFATTLLFSRHRSFSASREIHFLLEMTGSFSQQMGTILSTAISVGRHVVGKGGWKDCEF